MQAHLRYEMRFSGYRRASFVKYHIVSRIRVELIDKVLCPGMGKGINMAATAFLL